MIGDAIAGWIGHKIDASDGEGGTLGAITGVAAWKTAKAVAPALFVLGGIALGIHYINRRSAAAPA